MGKCVLFPSPRMPCDSLQLTLVSVRVPFFFNFAIAGLCECVLNGMIVNFNSIFPPFYAIEHCNLIDSSRTRMYKISTYDCKKTFSFSIDPILMHG